MNIKIRIVRSAIAKNGYFSGIVKIGKKEFFYEARRGLPISQFLTVEAEEFIERVKDIFVIKIKRERGGEEISLSQEEYFFFFYLIADFLLKHARFSKLISKTGRMVEFKKEDILEIESRAVQFLSAPKFGCAVSPCLN